MGCGDPAEWGRAEFSKAEPVRPLYEQIRPIEIPQLAAEPVRPLYEQFTPIEIPQLAAEPVRPLYEQIKAVRIPEMTAQSRLRVDDGSILIARIDALIDEWCDLHARQPLSLVLPTWQRHDFTTESWRAVRQALAAVRDPLTVGTVRTRLTDLIAAIDQLVANAW
jgi:hypothetical protein